MVSELSIGITQSREECSVVEDRAKGRFASGELRKVRDALRRARGSSHATGRPTPTNDARHRRGDSRIAKGSRGRRRARVNTPNLYTQF